MSARLRTLDGLLAVVRLPPDAGLPWWAAGSTFLSLTRTPDETSIVCDESRVPDGVTAEGSYRALRVQGPLPLSATGVLASMAAPLAVAGVPIFAISTYDTDYILVPANRLESAVEALRGAGHSVTE